MKKGGNRLKFLLPMIMAAFLCVSCSSDPTLSETRVDPPERMETESIVVSEDMEEESSPIEVTKQEEALYEFSMEDVPAYSDEAYVVLNDNIPAFSEKDMVTTSYEEYEKLDSLGRCGPCTAVIGQDIMPTEERGSIGKVKPSGWQTVKYDIVDGKYLYNRCHLIGFQLTGENSNVRNLITGTRYLNVEGMLPFENMVADYVKETNNHVLYRVTPRFEGDNLLASGVQIEAKSVEDDGEGILFHVYCYNVQPGISLNYADGSSLLIETQEPKEEQPEASQEEVQEPTSAEMCWQSATGSKYHSINDCGRMNPDKATQITVEEAVNLGLGKCSKCY